MNVRIGMPQFLLTSNGKSRQIVMPKPDGKSMSASVKRNNECNADSRDRKIYLI